MLAWCTHPSLSPMEALSWPDKYPRLAQSRMPMGPEPGLGGSLEGSPDTGHARQCFRAEGSKALAGEWTVFTSLACQSLGWDLECHFP